MKLSKMNRKLHRWGSILALAPMMIIIITGIILMLKKESAWIQPPTKRGVDSQLAIDFEQILEAARTVEQAGIKSWDDVDRLDVRPGKGVVKVRAKNRWEVQIDTKTGEVLQCMVRRSDLLESIHDGSYFHDGIKLWVFLPSGVILAILVLTGVHLFSLPHMARRRKQRKAQDASNDN
jgi:uncharacterized iron-regulated membrane protein